MLLLILSVIAYLTLFVLGYYYALASHSTFWLILCIGTMFAATIVFLVFLWNCIYSLRSRHRFCAKIKRFARKNGYLLSFSHTPHQAFYHAYEGEDIILTTDQKTYYLKFFPYFTRKKNIHIIDNRHAIFSKPFALVAPRKVYGMANVALTESLFDRAKKINLNFNECKEDAERIIIISPSCHSLSRVKSNGRDVIDNAYRQEDGTAFWYQNSFLDYLQR